MDWGDEGGRKDAVTGRLGDRESEEFSVSSPLRSCPFMLTQVSKEGVAEPKTRGQFSSSARH